jgi:hypothetical protein
VPPSPPGATLMPKQIAALRMLFDFDWPPELSNRNAVAL